MGKQAAKSRSSTSEKASLKSKSFKKTVDAFEMPPYLQSQLRLFFTLDIVGSTAYKQKNMSLEGVLHALPENAASRKKVFHSAWFKAIGDFYENTPTMVSAHWKSFRDMHKLHSIDIGAPPTFWKAMGDELGFTKRIENLPQITASLNTLLKVLNATRKALKNESPELDIKACAWIAGFPVTNTEVVFPVTHTSTDQEYENTHDDSYVFNSLAKLREFYLSKDTEIDKKEQQKIQWVRDFTGPSIDTGFRIASLATPRKLIISLELAYLLAIDAKEIQSSTDKDLPSRELKTPIVYHGRHSLKGVMGGNPYPIFWLDTENTGEYHQLHEAEAALLGTNSDDGMRVKTNDLKIFCEAFFERNESYLTKPYILKGGANQFGDVSENHLNRLRQLKAIVMAFEEDSQVVKHQNFDVASPDLGSGILTSERLNIS